MRAFRWSVAAGLLACGCTGPAVPRSGDPPIEAAHQSEAATPPTPAPTSVVSVAELRAIAPELTERSAARLVEAFGQSGQPADAIAEAGLMTASQGFRTFDGALMAETAGLLGESYETLTPGDRARLGTYLDHVRAGGAAPDEAREGRRLFAQAVRNLDDARRSRLTALYEQGIVAGIR
jgi:hypothetical protein